MNLTNFDLNLLKTLLVLLQEKNTNRAAERLNTSQPAVSRTLGRLRKELDDPLFLRHSRGLTLTPQAEQMAMELPDIMARLEQTLHRNGFDPSRQSGRLALALNGFVIESHGFQIYQSVKKAAPDVLLELYSYSQMTVSQLISGEIDGAVNYYPLDVAKELRQIPVGALTFGLICRAGHPLANSNIDVADMFDYELAGIIIPDHNIRQLLVKKFATTGVKVKARFRCQQVNPVLKAVEHSDMLFVAPVSLLSSLDRRKFSTITVNLSEDILAQKLALIYNHRHSQSPKFKWLEKLIRESLNP